jgi:hypothetical protein
MLLIYSKYAGVSAAISRQKNIYGYSKADSNSSSDEQLDAFRSNNFKRSKSVIPLKDLVRIAGTLVNLFSRSKTDRKSVV